MNIKTIITMLCMAIPFWGFAQTGHIMQGTGAVNMSMGGASTAQPIDVSGALQWNPAAITTFDQKILSFSAGAFLSSPEISSSLPAGMLGPSAPAVSGTTEDDRGVSIMPALAMVWGSGDSKHTFGVSAFGISGFGVTFPEEPNNPLSPSFNPTDPSNPINYPQQAGGFGHLESDYLILQVGIAYAYKLSDKFSIGIQPNIDYGRLMVIPNPLAAPDAEKGYPESDKSSAIGYGAQVGVFFDSQSGFKWGISYKTNQYFGELEMKNTYLDNTSAPSNKFRMDYPAILSAGIGYSKGAIDFALDYRYVFYSNTEGFEAKGWTQQGSIVGFGWNDISIVSAGIQFKGVAKLPIRVGYTYNTSPIDEELVFFSAPATAVIKNAFQFGLGYEVSERLAINGVFHYGTSSGSTSGELLSPLAVSPSNPYGALPGTTVSYSMNTSMIMLGVNYMFKQ